MAKNPELFLLAPVEVKILVSWSSAYKITSQFIYLHRCSVNFVCNGKQEQYCLILLLQKIIIEFRLLIQTAVFIIQFSQKSDDLWLNHLDCHLSALKTFRYSPLLSNLRLIGLKAREILKKV